MNPKTKTWLITAAALVLVGCIIFGGAMMALKWDFSKLSTFKYETNEHTINENYKNISVISDTADITFFPSESTATTVICSEQENIKHSVTVKDDTLTIEMTDTRKWYEYIGINFENSKIDVYLPERAYEALNIKASTGDIDIPENFSFKSIDINVSTGDVENRASATEGIKIKTSTGDIAVSNVSAGSLELSVSTGKITASSVACTGDLNVRVSTGKTALLNVTCKNLTSTGNTGKISLTNVYVNETMLIDRTTGDVTFENCDASLISVKTDTGDVRGTLHSGKTFYTSTSTGKVSVPGTTGGICEITTSTGDIKIDIATY